MVAVEEWLKMVLSKTRKAHTFIHMQWQTQPSIIFLSTSSSPSSLADSSSLPKTAAIPPSNIITAMLKVNEGAK